MQYTYVYIYNLLKKSQLKHMYYIKIPTVRFMDLVRSMFEGLKNLDGIRHNGLSGHLVCMYVFMGVLCMYV